ncbi:hypothetical protein Scep_019470 [Stephania cephalantha]|uniref:Uncharacterized protein n=1 Tax=Stephania cephalantha TaxID=152367 RepID=A0AAP0IAQ6_9MAGN
MGKGNTSDGYTMEVTGAEGVRVLVASKAKPNRNFESNLDRKFFVSFLNVLNLSQQRGRFNFTTQFPHYKDVIYKPDFGRKKLRKPVVFDMDMSSGDFSCIDLSLKSTCGSH